MPLVLCLTFLVGPRFLLAQQVLGHVVDLRGDWYLYPEGAESSQAKRLSKWQDVPAGGVVRVKSPNVGDYISIVDAYQLKPLATKRCDSASGCYQPIILPHALPSTESLPLLHYVWNVVVTEPYQQSLHRVRGMSSLFSEGVARLVNGRVDLSESMRQLPRGKYSLKSYNPQRSSDQTAELTTFDWVPGAVTIISVPDLKPGLYEALRQPGDQSELAVKASLWFLLCDPQEYPAALSSFRNVRARTDQWENTSPETVHAFLRAYLAELARAGSAFKIR